MNHPPTPSKDRELAKLDIAAAIERALWAAYHDGDKQAKRMGGSNRVILDEKEHILKILAAHRDSLKQSLVAEMPKPAKGWTSKEWSNGHDEALDEVMIAINKVFNGRM
jgi:hypothetical protein